MDPIHGVTANQPNRSNCAITPLSLPCLLLFGILVKDMHTWVGIGFMLSIFLLPHKLSPISSRAQHFFCPKQFILSKYVATDLSLSFLISDTTV